MATSPTLSGGGFEPMNFTGFTSWLATAGQAAYADAFGSGASLATLSDIYDKATPAMHSPNESLWIYANNQMTVPGGYKYVYDQAHGDTVTTSERSQLTFLQDNGAGQGTVLHVLAGSNTIFGGGADTVIAGDASITMFAGRNGATVQGGEGSVYFIGGTGAVSVAGGHGNTTLFGGSGSAGTYLKAGAGLNYLIAGGGTGNTTLVGGAGPSYEFANGSGATTMIGGSAVDIMVGVTGTGTELFKTGSGTALIGLNTAADTVIGGSGASTVIGGPGTGVDTYAFVKGQAGGTELITAFKVGTDALIFTPDYGSKPIASENITKLSGWGTSDVITLTDGTTITLVGVTHKLES
jgi:Ca2+-binding RTX toxin-like protein